MAKNYMTVEPDRVAILGKHFTPGRGGRKIRYITRHHTAGVLNADQINSVWTTRPASAHYLIGVTGIVSQHVWDANTAWSNANSVSNQESITIEHSNSAGAAQDWPIAAATIDEGARWAAALCRYYKLGRPHFGTNIRDHRQFTSTSCPYHLAAGGKYHNRYMSVAQAFYDELTNPNSAPAPKPSPEEDVMAADLNTRIKVASGEEHRAQDLIKWTDERVYELTREGGRLDRLEAKIDKLIEKES